MSVGAGAPALVDTHCHLALLEERGLLAAALDGAAEAGVDQMVSIGLNLEDTDRNRVIAEAHDNVWFTVGWHPHEPRAPDPAQLDALAELLRHPRAVAVGEVGLDLFVRPGYADTPLTEQRRALRMMLELGAAHGKPAVIHDRDAHEEVLMALADVPSARGVMHCFSGDAAYAARCTAAGYALSFSGIITFPRSEDQQAAAIAASLDDLLVETDAPFLAPVPFRGRTNLPGYVAATAARLASLRGDDEVTVRAATTRNARRMFGLPGDGS